jgi:hypothetical protein
VAGRLNRSSNWRLRGEISNSSEFAAAFVAIRTDSAGGWINPAPPLGLACIMVADTGFGTFEIRGCNSTPSAIAKTNPLPAQTQACMGRCGRLADASASDEEPFLARLGFHRARCMRMS